MDENFVKTVAVKIVRFKNNPAALTSFAKELKILAHLQSHVNVAKLIGIISTNVANLNGLHLFSLIITFR